MRNRLRERDADARRRRRPANRPVSTATAAIGLLAFGATELASALSRDVPEIDEDRKRSGRVAT